VNGAKAKESVKSLAAQLCLLRSSRSGGDKIEGVSSNLIHVSSKGLDYEEKAILDLKKDTITITEALGDNLIRID